MKPETEITPARERPARVAPRRLPVGEADQRQVGDAAARRTARRSG
jgi:hypothetical protein